MPTCVESMFNVGETPWHKKGITLYEPPQTSEEAIKHAGLAWEVKKIPIFAPDGQEIDGYFGVQRSDNNSILGVVGKDYEPMQNTQAFGFFDPLLEDQYAAYETAGSIDEGKIVWVLAKVITDGKFDAVKGDEVHKYLLLSNSHDGSSAINIKFTPVRVVCKNTLNFALSKGDSTKIRHLPYFQNSGHTLECLQFNHGIY